LNSRQKLSGFQVITLLPSLGFASGRQAFKILQQLISYREPNKWWAGQVIQQGEKRNPQKIIIYIFVWSATAQLVPFYL
jgi:hypothetical protein